MLSNDRRRLIKKIYIVNDTLGGVLKGAVGQYLALEMSRGNSRDNKAVSRYLPWLNNAPSSLQQGAECVGHMRSFTHMALIKRRQKTHSIPNTLPPIHPPGQGQQPTASVHYQHQGVTYSQPVPQETSCHIADHIQVIFAGFAKKSKTSVLHMSSLFHAFTLCQLWTIYLEQMAYNISSNVEGSTLGVLFEFWAKVTPCIVQLAWHGLYEEQQAFKSEALLKWVQRLQFKMGQIEDGEILRILQKSFNGYRFSPFIPSRSRP